MDQTVTIRVPLPESLLDQYQKQAEQQGIPVERVLAARLAGAVDFTAQKPLYFTDEDRRALDTLFARNFNSPAEVLGAVRAIFSAKLDNVRIPLKAPVLTRLKSRAGSSPFPAWVARVANEELERYVGMR